MVNVFDVPANELIPKVSEKLKDKDEIKVPDWAKIVKTGPSKERPPQQEDFWYIRASSILRTLYVEGEAMGTNALRRRYGGREKNRTRPQRSLKAGGKIIRKILQQLGEDDLVEKKDKQGRIISDKGKSLIDKIAAEITKEKE